MGFNLRKLLSGKNDEELISIRSESQYSVCEAERGYKKGGISPDLAQLACDCVETSTVVSAVMKKRIETGDEGSHKRLRDTSVKFSPKRIERGWGEWLSERRRV